MIQAALAYAGLRWRVHPCRPGEKLPLLEGWQNRATTDPTMIERWWGRSPDANVAVATGPGSGIFALDVDGPRGEYTLVKLERRHGCLPDLYPQQWTGGGRGGWQAFFAWPEERLIRNSAGRLGPKLDSRGSGGYVLVPPSKTKEPYRWADDRSPWDLLPEPAPPGWSIYWIRQQRQSRRGKRGRNRATGPATSTCSVHSRLSWRWSRPHLKAVGTTSSTSLRSTCSGLPRKVGCRPMRSCTASVSLLVMPASISGRSTQP